MVNVVPGGHRSGLYLAADRQKMQGIGRWQELGLLHSTGVTHRRLRFYEVLIASISNEADQAVPFQMADGRGKVSIEIQILHWRSIMAATISIFSCDVEATAPPDGLHD